MSGDLDDRVPRAAVAGGNCAFSVSQCYGPSLMALVPNASRFARLAPLATVLVACGAAATHADYGSGHRSDSARVVAGADRGLHGHEAGATPGGGRRLTVTGTGDLLLHIKVVATGRERGWDRVFAGLGSSLGPEEIVFANLETPLADDILPVKTGSPPILGAPPEVASALARAGVDVLGLANNHAYDQQSLGMLRTIEALDQAGLIGVGAGKAPEEALAPRIVVRPEGKVAFLSVTERVNRGPAQEPPLAHIAKVPDAEELAPLLAEARKQADIVVLAVHWSHDFLPGPSFNQRRKARRWVELGADVILGTGPHILHSVEVLPSERGDAVVAYSLGNLVSNQGQRYRVGRSAHPRLHKALRLPESRDAVLLRAGYEIRGGRLHLSSLGAVPLWTDNNYFSEEARDGRWDIRVRRLSEMDEETRNERIAAIRQALGPAVDVDF